MREYLRCKFCDCSRFISDIDKKNIKMNFSVVVDKETRTKRLVYENIITAPYGKIKCDYCGREVSLEEDE